MDLRALRSAIYRGDAEVVVSVAASGPWDGRLQLVGDALIMAAERSQPGAEGLARRCADAARERGWSGDDELAASLGKALTGAADSLRPLPVDLEQLSEALEQGLGEDPGRLDITTGEVWRPALSSTPSTLRRTTSPDWRSQVAGSRSIPRFPTRRIATWSCSSRR
ncbi:MAG: hypothetical protein M3N47_07790 [Chloroflexota bacterium]|nr:hypothetical protein [Chloroflexota bacterium]